MGKTISLPTLKVEFFEIFDDPFVLSEFERRKQIFIPILNRQSWIPTAEDVIVQKLRWGRSKDLDDLTDILAVQDPENLDIPYIENWCSIHQTTSRLSDTLARIPPM